MTKKGKRLGDAKRLGESISKNQKRARTRRTRKNSLRSKPGGDAGRTVAIERDLSPLARLMGALRNEKIRFQLIGMSAAVLQGVPVVTHDIDLWIDLPSRRYMQAVNVAVRNGARIVRNTVVELSDGMLVKFIYEVTGLGSFKTEIRKAQKLIFGGCEVPVMPLESIRKSKAAIMRDKNPAHIHSIDQVLRLRRKGIR